MGQCYAYLDNGNRCRRNAKRLNGLCGTCHGITVEYKRCTHPVASGQHCGRSHKTLEEIAEHKAAQSRRRRQRSRPGGASTPRWASYGTGQRPGGTAGSRGTSQKTQRARSGSYNSPPKKPSAKPRARRELSKAAKREAATLCAEAIRSQGVVAAFESQITDYVSEKLVEELAKNWDGRQCEEIAKLARGLLAVKSYFYRILRIVLNWLMLRMGYGETARFFACQLVVAVPVVWYAKLVAAARILQISGICLCLINDRSLKECRCLHDLVLFEGKEAINRLMTGAVHDWREIAQRVPEVQVPPSSARGSVP
jgi:hypothetical protein